MGCHSAATLGSTAASELVTETFRFMQKGQRVWCRLAMAVAHSWSGPSGHFHQTRLPEPQPTPAGVRSPFFVGCHSAAISGATTAREFVEEMRLSAQNGQPARCRWTTCVFHTCSGPFGHFHQATLTPEPSVPPSSGVRGRFLVGCHCFATSGSRVASEVSGVTRWPEQNGHPVPSFTRFLGVVCHSCPRAHLHQKRFEERG